MTADLPPHDHCRYCGRAVPFDMAYCCMDCYSKAQKRIAKEKRNSALTAVLAVGGAAAILILGYIF